MALLLKQKRFCEEYIVDFNATQAAIRAGYSKKTAGSIGSENLKKPEIKKYIAALLSDASLSAEETKKMLSDMARSSLNDYFIIKKVERRTRIEIPLAEYIQQLQDQYQFEEEFASQAGYNDDETKAHVRNQVSQKRVILKHQLELNRNPKATIIVDGPVVWEEVAELDMVKLVADKEKGKIKSITPGQFGTKVELYAADGALVNVARIHGLFEKDNSQLKPHVVPLNDSQVDKILDTLKKLK